ncbi:MAG: hypothetical protein Q8K36_00755, partial [Alphaproteobacteria bacterium]|nr:hypothetical protein [Alphaproteobacteria bacterium]
LNSHCRRGRHYPIQHWHYPNRASYCGGYHDAWLYNQTRFFQVKMQAQPIIQAGLAKASPLIQTTRASPSLQ